jgi:molecular chaperone IbpA
MGQREFKLCFLKGSAKMIETIPNALLRHYIGLDRMSRLAEAAQSPNYPPFNIEQVGDDKYVLSLAVAGFREDEINISLHDSTLTIKGEKPFNGQPEPSYLHRGLSFRDFTRTFAVAQYIEVLSANMENGLLTITLERIVPESAKPKRIPIGESPPKLKIVETDTQEAMPSGYR